jgi:hypothetical protein
MNTPLKLMPIAATLLYSLVLAGCANIEATPIAENEPSTVIPTSVSECTLPVKNGCRTKKCKKAYRRAKKQYVRCVANEKIITANRAEVLAKSLQTPLVANNPIVLNDFHTNSLNHFQNTYHTDPLVQFGIDWNNRVREEERERLVQADKKLQELKNDPIYQLKQSFAKQYFNPPPPVQAPNFQEMLKNQNFSNAPITPAPTFQIQSIQTAPNYENLTAVDVGTSPTAQNFDSPIAAPVDINPIEPNYDGLSAVDVGTNP